jgi:hypothetical protein
MKLAGGFLVVVGLGASASGMLPCSNSRTLTVTTRQTLRPSPVVVAAPPPRVIISTHPALQTQRAPTTRSQSRPPTHTAPVLQTQRPLSRTQQKPRPVSTPLANVQSNVPRQSPQALPKSAQVQRPQQPKNPQTRHPPAGPSSAVSRPRKQQCPPGTKCRQQCLSSGVCTIIPLNQQCAAGVRRYDYWVDRPATSANWDKDLSNWG